MAFYGQKYPKYPWCMKLNIREFTLKPEKELLE